MIDDEHDMARMRAAIASASKVARHNPADAERKLYVDDLKAQYRSKCLENHIKKVVDAAPPLSAEQRSRLAILLRPAVGDGAE